MPVKVGPYELACVQPGSDSLTDDAIRQAERLRRTDRFRVREAIVDRDGGIILLDQRMEHATQGLHLNTPRSGSNSGLHAAVEILAMFGFGRKDLLREQLQRNQFSFFIR